MTVITLRLQTLKLSLPRKIDFQTGDEDFFLGKINGPYNEITNMANLVSFHLVNFSRLTLNSDCHQPCDQLSDTESKRLFRCKVLEQMVMLDI